MLYLSQFVFQSILFSKKKEHAGDSWHPLVPSGDGGCSPASHGQCSLTPPSPASPPPDRLQAALPHREGAPATYTCPGPPPESPAQCAQSFLFRGPSAPGRPETGWASTAGDLAGTAHSRGHPSSEPSWLLLGELPSELQAQHFKSADLFS